MHLQLKNNLSSYGEFIKQKAQVQAVELSPHFSTPVCDVVTYVTGQIDTRYKCFHKLRHRHRHVCCHLLLYFHSKLRKDVYQMLFICCQQFPPSTRFKLKDVDRVLLFKLHASLSHLPNRHLSVLLAFLILQSLSLTLL